VLNAEHFKRIDALNYTMMLDDGQHVEGLEEADMVLVGVSRTSKTPTSIYLAGLIRTLLGRVAIAYCARHDQGR
jgi:regulator of PEP synthase PpsR (kinase-PPPase family)